MVEKNAKPEKWEIPQNNKYEQKQESGKMDKLKKQKNLKSHNHIFHRKING